MKLKQWKISSQFDHMSGLKVYQVYCLLDEDKTDHNGNRLYTDEIFDNREDALEFIDKIHQSENRMLER